jgi:DNA-binding Lrp family transcriptional regulator
MPKGYVLINTDTGSDADVAKELNKIEGTIAETIYGVYDIIATVNAETMDKLKEIIRYRVRSIGGIRSTLTVIVTEEAKP